MESGLLKGLALIVRQIVLRHTTRRPLRTILTISGIATGVALLVTILVINASLLSAVDTSIRTLAGSARIEVAAANQTGLEQSIVSELRNIPGVEEAIPLIRVAARISGERGETRAFVLGITPDIFALFPRDLGELSQIEIRGGFGPNDNGILASGRLAERLRIRPGSRVTIETAKGESSAPITGSISGGSVDLVNGGIVAVTSLKNAQDLFGKEGRVDSVFLTTKSGFSESGIESAIEEQFGRSVIVGPPGQRARGFERAFESIATLTFLAATVSLFVSLFVVYNTMWMSFVERRRQISIALAIGATRRQIVLSFLTEAALLGIVASLAGLAGGLLFARLVITRALTDYMVIPIAEGGSVTVDGQHLLLGAGSGVLISVLGAFIPARRVMSVAPIESLRPAAPYEAGGLGPTRGRRTLLTGLAAIGLGMIALPLFPHVANPLWLVLSSLMAWLVGLTLLLPWIVSSALHLLRPLLSKSFKVLGRLSVDNLLKNPRRTALTVGALLLALAMVIGVGSAFGSYKAQFARSIALWFGAPLYVETASFRGITSDQPLSGALAQRLEEIDGVSAVYARRHPTLNVLGEQVVFYAVQLEEAEGRDPTTKLSGTGGLEGSLVAALSRDELVISRSMADRRQLSVGDSIPLATARGLRNFRIGGLFDDLAPFDTAYIRYSTYGDLWLDETADRFAIVPDENADVMAVKKRLSLFLKSRDIPARVLTTDQLVGNLLGTVEGLLALASGIQAAALVIAALIIMNTVFIAVLQRRWEFGLQQAIGMSKRQLVRMVLLEAGTIGLIGGACAAVLGSIVGILMLQSMEARFAWHIPFEASLLQFAWPVFVGIAGAILAALYPTRLAARVSIVECLRFE